MNLHYQLEQNKNLSVALGFFDGVHIAHKELIKKTVLLAKENNLKSAVITFLEPPLSKILNKEVKLITPLEEKIELIESLGVDELYIPDFSDFMNIEAEDYLNNILINYFEPKFIVTGFNHTFGKNKKGSPRLLKKMEGSYKYFEIPKIESMAGVISSTNIKTKIESGDFKSANEMLGRTFTFKGPVQKGQGIARKLGYNTANLIWDDRIIKPKYGVYSGFCEYQGKIYKSMINFGTRPSVDKTLKETLEVHLLNFEGDLYDKEIKVGFEFKIRNEIKFPNIEELKKQINEDYKIISVHRQINPTQA